MQLTEGLILYKKLSGKQYGTQLYVVMRLTEEGGNLVNILSEYPLTRAALGSPAERAALGEGGKYPPPLLTHEPGAVASLARRQSKALNEYFPRVFLKFS